MSSFTTISSSMEDQSVEELVDTRLSLSLVLTGAGSRPPAPVQAAVPPCLAPPAEEQAPDRKRKKKGGSGTSTAATTTTRRHGKRARTMHEGGDDDDDDGDGGGDDTGGGGGSARKKLRLTTEQAALLEDSFRAHNVLSHEEKHDLARRVRLSARQVEVWFQNRRARTKLKQKELDCELLRRWCERLSDDNARLRRELAEARSSSSSSSAAVSRLTTVNTAACRSCNNKLAGGAGRMAT